MIKPPATNSFDKFLTFIYFIGFEVAVYYGLSFLLFDQVPTNPDNQENIIVKNWNGVIYFFLLYAAITIGTMLFLSSALPRKHKPQVMRYFWLAWLGLLIMLVIGFN